MNVERVLKDCLVQVLKKLEKKYKQILDSHPEEKKRLEECLKEIYDIGLKLNVTYVLMYNIGK